MLHVQNGVYLLATNPVTHSYTYTDGAQAITRVINTPLDGWGFETVSGYKGYMLNAAPSPNPYVYSSVSLTKTDGTTTQYTQAAEVVGGRTRYYRYVDGVRNGMYPSYDEPGKYTILLSSADNDLSTGLIRGTVRIVWTYKHRNGGWYIDDTDVANVVLKQGGGTQTEYTYSVTETVS